MVTTRKKLEKAGMDEVYAEENLIKVLDGLEAKTRWARKELTIAALDNLKDELQKTKKAIEVVYDRRDKREKAEQELDPAELQAIEAELEAD